MSQELLDEVEALNAIYEGSVEACTNQLYDVIVPEKNIRIRMSFPASYPDSIPQILSANGPRELLELIRERLRNVYSAGQVVLFDFIELLRTESLTADTATTGAIAPTSSSTDENDELTGQQAEDSIDIEHWVETIWTSSDKLVDRKSQFIARASPVYSADEALEKIRRLKTERRIARATHNITAYRIVREDGVLVQDCDDDGESAAGGRLLHLLQLTDSTNVVVVVSRWFGGVHLGPDRFKHINSCARQALERGSFIGK